MKFLSWMKVTMAMVVIWFMFLPDPAKGQQYGYETTCGGAGYTIAGNTVSNIAMVFGGAKYDAFVLEIKFACHSAGTSNITFTWSTSADGVDYANTGPGQGSFTVGPSTGTTQVNFLTNITLNSIGYFRLDTMSNGNVAVLTNWCIRPYKKPKRQG